MHRKYNLILSLNISIKIYRSIKCAGTRKITLLKSREKLLKIQSTDTYFVSLSITDLKVNYKILVKKNARLDRRISNNVSRCT